MSCGRCCQPGFNDDGTYVRVKNKDIWRLAPDERDAVVGIRNSSGKMEYRLKVKPMDGAWACVFLSGEIGGHVQCSIYERRPQICRDFDRGGAWCLDTLAEAMRLEV